MKKKRCEGLKLDGRRCKNPATEQTYGLSMWVCGVHKRSIDKTFADAEKRWRDAGEPESDL